MIKKKACLFLKFLIICLLLGFFCGVIGTLFSKTVSFVTNLRQNNLWLIYLLPVAGVVSALLYRLFKVSGQGTNQVIVATKQANVLSYKLAPAVFLSSALSHLCGASVGREGAALQLGGSSAVLLSKGLKLTEKEEKILIYCGMAGVFSSVFGTPLAAATFALEVVFVGHICFNAVIPAFITSLVSYFTAHLLGTHAERFIISFVPTLDFSVAWKFLVLSLLATAVGIIFCLSIRGSEKLFEKIFKNEILRIAIGGIAIILFTLLVGSYDYNGTGVHIIENIFQNGKFVPLAFLLKILFTCISVGTGYKGGEIVPTLFIGATFGAFIGSFLGLPVGFSAAISMITLFASVTNCPLASVLLALELFSGKAAGYVVVAVIISYCLSGKTSLYSAQKTGGFKKKLW